MLDRGFFISGCIVAALCAVGGCKGSDSTAALPKTDVSGPMSPASSRLAIFVNDAPIAALTAKELEAWPRLDTIVPVAARRLGTWTSIGLVGASPAEVRAPSKTHPDLVPAVFPGADGKPAFGMFDPVELAKRGKPAVQHDHLREVRITRGTDSGRGENEHGEGGSSDPTQIRISVKTTKGTTVIEGATLLKIPRENVPGTTDPKGWTLETILGAAGVTAFDKLVLSDARGTALNLDKAAFTKRSIPYIKLNRQGQLRLRVFEKQGANWNPTGGDLREFVAMEVVQ